MKKLTKRLFNTNFWTAFLFWSWNAIFLTFIFFGFAPNVLPELLLAIKSRAVPPAFPIFALLIVIIPIVAVLTGFKWLRKEPKRLFALAYGVQWPLMLLTVIRLFVFRALVPPVILLLISAMLGLLAYAWLLFDKRETAPGKTTAVLRLFGMTLLFVVGTYAAIWLSFYIVPIIELCGDLLGVISRGTWYAITHPGEVIADIGLFLSDTWRNLRNVDWQDVINAFTFSALSMLPVLILGPILLLFTGSLLLGFPVAMIALYWRGWMRALRDGVATFGRIPTYATAALLIGGLILSFNITNRQPQQNAFNLLRTAPTTPAEARALTGQESALRKGLLNAFIARQRYISAEGQVRHINDMYGSMLWDEPNGNNWRLSNQERQKARDAITKRVEVVTQLYEDVARPVLYQPVVDPTSTVTVERDRVADVNDAAESAELYQQYFDRPIIEGERPTIVRAAKSSWSVAQATADWQAVDDREVHLDEQHITITENGNMATVELYEVYSNQTANPQEVVYYFSLPESAVVTALWLNDEADKATAFQHRIAPRGAAQQVYNEQKVVNRDPALVEQIGPTQYRLRVFPIPEMTWTYDYDNRSRPKLTPGKQQHMWLEYRVLEDTSWPLPDLALRRNVYWDRETERTVNGVAVAHSDDWMQHSVAIQKPAEPFATWQRADFPNGHSVLVRAVEHHMVTDLPADLNIAVVLDRSRSMQQYERDVAATLTQIAALEADVDLYLTASAIRGEEPELVEMGSIDVEDIFYFGGQNSAELLVQFDALRGDRAYDAVLVLTDDTGYELGDPNFSVPRPSEPTWMIHLGGYPLGYDDDTLEAIQASGGGAVRTLDDALTRITNNQQQSRASSEIVNGYIWMTLDSAEADTMSAVEANPNIAPFAARRLILSEMVRQRENLDALDSLDDLHAIAVENSIVTPYSSMIVLVNQQQQNRLDALENAEDRFDREFEALTETQQFNGVAGVPEPHEYILMALAAIMLIGYLRKSRNPLTA